MSCFPINCRRETEVRRFVRIPFFLRQLPKHFWVILLLACVSVFVIGQRLIQAEEEFISIHLRKVEHLRDAIDSNREFTNIKDLSASKDAVVCKSLQDHILLYKKIEKSVQDIKIFGRNHDGEVFQFLGLNETEGGLPAHKKLQSPDKRLLDVLKK